MTPGNGLLHSPLAAVQRLLERFSNQGLIIGGEPGRTVPTSTGRYPAGDAGMSAGRGKAARQKTAAPYWLALVRQSRHPTGRVHNPSGVVPYWTVCYNRQKV